MALFCLAAQAQSLESNDVAVAFSGGDTSGLPGVVNGVRLNVEVTDEQTSRGFRSMSLIVDVDCPGSRERLRKAEAFDLPNLAGPPQPHSVSGERAIQEAYMGEVIKTICAVHGLRVVAQGGGETPAAARGPTLPAEPPTPPPPAAPANPTDPAAFSGAASPAPTPEREPYAAPAAPETASPTLPSSPAAAAGFLSQARVQIASSPSRADAEARLGRSAALIAPPLRGEVEVATVHGRTVYRSIIAPFGSTSDAQAFCARTRPNLDGCFVWPAR